MYGSFEPVGAIERSEFQDEKWHAATVPIFDGDPVNLERNSSLAVFLRPLFRINERIESQLRAWRWGRPVQTFSLFGFLIAQAVLANVSVATEQVVRFDVPAFAEAVAVTEANAFNGELMEIKLLIPVTTEIGAADRNHVNEFRYDIRWQHANYPVVDYGPRTRTTSVVDGTIQVKKQGSRNVKVGLALNGIDPPGFAGTANAEAGTSKSESNQYQEIPRHDVLVASGTVDRGTGTFFRFHRSRSETLEGSRDLFVSFRVPQDWQAGLLQVKCHARGERKVASLWSEPIENVKSFTLPVYLGSSSLARDRAVEYVRAERGLRQSVATRQAAEQASKPSGLESVFRGLVGLTDNETKVNNGTHGEPQSRVVRYRVPMSEPDVSGRYRNAREELLQLSR